MTERRRARALDAALSGMFKRLEDRGVPEHVMRVVEQLDEAQAGNTRLPVPPGEGPDREPHGDSDAL